jgi:Ribbon-helix-helix protein, copG family
MAERDKEMVSFRLPADLVKALREHAEGNGENLSDALRRGALLVLGICPTCGRPMGSGEA